MELAEELSELDSLEEGIIHMRSLASFLQETAGGLLTLKNHLVLVTASLANNCM